LSVPRLLRFAIIILQSVMQNGASSASEFRKSAGDSRHVKE
jgi:hypothetical protein